MGGATPGYQGGDWYNNNESRSNRHIKTFQQKNKHPNGPFLWGEAVLVIGMEYLDRFGTVEGEEDQRP